MAKSENIQKVLSIRKEEQAAVYLLLSQTVFLGVFLALFDISTTSLFINAYGESMISKAFLVSGVVGFGMSALYYRAQNSWKFSKLVVNNLLFISVVTILLRVSFYFSDSNVLIFIAFILMGPLNLLGIVGFWGMAGRLFTLRQGKRLFSLIDAGQTFGMILISFLIPILLNLLTNNKDLLFISAGSILIALLIQFVIVNRFDLNKDQADEYEGDGSKKQKLKLADIYSNKYLRSMSSYVILSMLAAFYMFYIFLPTTKNLYPGEDEYTVFLGMFTGTLMIFTFLIKTLAYDKITKNYGIKVSLLLPPFLLGVFVILAMLTGFFFGTSPGVSSYVLFFLFVALGRLFSVSLKNAIEIPSQKILYQSLDGTIRHKVQVALDGMVNEIATITAGVLLFVMGLFEFFTIIHYAVFLFLIAVAWIFTALHVHREYKNSLGAALEEEGFSGSKELNELTYKDFDPEIDFLRNIKRMKINQSLCHLRHDKFFTDLFAQEEIENVELFTDFITENHVYMAVKSMKHFISNTKNEIQKNIVRKSVHILEDEIEKNHSEKEIRKLVSSAYPLDRAIAAKILGYKKNESLSHLIITLLRDYDPQVKLSAIYAAAQLKDRSSRTIIIDLLQDEQFNIVCYDALKLYGEEVMDQLEQLFYKSALPLSIQLQIISLYAYIGSSAVKYLINKMEYSSQKVVHAAIHAMIYVGYRPEIESEKQKILLLLKEEVSNLAWNLNVATQISKKVHGMALHEAFKIERNVTLEKVYNILMLVYNRQSVEQVKKNLDIGTSESVSYALELMDLFVDEEIKSILFIAFEDISDGEKVRRYQDHFPLPKLESIELLNDIINRDINYISRFTKACALEALKQLPDSSISDTCIAQLFNKDLMLKQEAALAIVNQSQSKFEEIVSRVDHQQRVLIKGLLTQSNQYSLYGLVSFVRQNNLFIDLNYNELVTLIENAKIIVLDQAEKIQFASNDLDIGILVDGELNYKLNERDDKNYVAPAFLSIHTELYTTNIDFVATTKSTILLLPYKKVLQFTNDFQQQEFVLSRII
jgi:AAA family ATP:ADP antiporter